MLSCWGRAYDWGGTNSQAFPAQITSQGRDLLSRPIKLSGTINSNAVSLDSANITWPGATSPSCVDFTATGSLGGTNGITVTVSNAMEYDGFLWMTIKVGGGQGGKTLSKLKLEIPFKAGECTLMAQQQALVSGKVKSFTRGMIGNPALWFGTEKAGIQWCPGDVIDWSRHVNNPNVLTFVTNATENVLTLTLVDQPVTMDKQLTYTMSFQAWPIKPWKADVRAVEMSLNGIGTFGDRKGWVYFWQQWNAGDHIAPRMGYQYPGPYTHADIDAFITQNKKPLIFWNQPVLWRADPVLKVFGNWGEYDANAVAGDPGSNSYVSADYNDPALRDYQVWMNYNLLTNNYIASNIAGFYNDNCNPVWTDDGVYLAIGRREVQKRVYNTIRENCPELLIANHQSFPGLWQASFADWVMSGEQYVENAARKSEQNYYHVLTLDGMRAEFLGYNYGVPRAFFPEPCGQTNVAASEHLVGMLWIHDIFPWNANMCPAPITQSGRAKDAFGWDADTTFHGYWDNAGLLTQNPANQDPIVTSVFKRNGRVLFVTMNNSDTNATVTITPNWTALGMTKPGVLMDVYKDQATPREIVDVPVVGESATFVVPRRNFRALMAAACPPPTVTATPVQNTVLPEGNVNFHGVINEGGTTLTNIAWNCGGPIGLLDNSLLLMYNLDGNKTIGEADATVKDSFNSQSYGTMLGNVGYLDSGRYGKALSFDGSNGRVHIKCTEALKYRGTSRTIACWARAHATEMTGGAIYSKPWNGNNEYNYSLTYRSDGRLQVGLGGGDGITPIINNTAMSKDVWHYIVVTLDGVSKAVKIYLDGQLSGQGTHSISSWTPNTDGNHDLTLGTLYPYSDPAWSGHSGFSFDGDIDEVRIFERVMSDGEIAQQYMCNLRRSTPTQFVFDGTLPLAQGQYNWALSAGAPRSPTVAQTQTLTIAPPDALVAHWKLDETNGVVAADASGYTNKATANSMAWVAGKINNAALLKAASSQRLAVADSPSFNYVKGVTVSTWLKLNALPGTGGGGIWSDINAYSKNGTIISVGPDGKIGFRVGDTNSFNALACPTSFQTGQWYHVACTYDNSAMKIFVNGGLTTNTSCSRVITDNTRTKLIGQMGWGPYSGWVFGRSTGV